MKTKNKFDRFSSCLVILIIISLIYSCSTRKPYIKTKFEGEWTDIGYLTFLGEIRYHFTFKSDSFYIKKHEATDVVMHTQSSPILYGMNIYSGTFRFDKDSIYLLGVRTDSLNEVLEKNDCIHEINFYVSYKYRFDTDTLILLHREFSKI